MRTFLEGLASFVSPCVLPLLPVYIIVGGLDIIKAVLGLVLVSKGIWIRNIIVKE